MGLEKRARRRDFCSVTFQYTYTVGVNGGSSSHTVAALSTNVSEGGIGMYTDRPLSEGVRLDVRAPLLRAGSAQAVVRWCSRISENLYRVGVMFEHAALPV